MQRISHELEKMVPPTAFQPQLTPFPIHPDHPLVPVHLLVFGIQAFITSLTCLADVWSWSDRSVAQKQQLTMLYSPYVALGMCPDTAVEHRKSALAKMNIGGLMALDMVFRLRDKLVPKSKRE